MLVDEFHRHLNSINHKMQFYSLSLSRIENISIIFIEETSNKQIVEEAASNGQVYFQKTQPGTHLIQVTSQGV